MAFKKSGHALAMKAAD